LNIRNSSSSNYSPYNGFKEYLQSTHREKSMVVDYRMLKDIIID
jgi:hypothetical protein